MTMVSSAGMGTFRIARTFGLVFRYILTKIRKMTEMMPVTNVGICVVPITVKKLT